MESFRDTYFYIIFRRLIKGKLAVTGLAVFIGIIAVSALAPWISPYDPNATNTSELLQPPSATYWMGTDELGRDVFSRIIYGTRISLVVGVIAVAMAMVLGSLLGLIAGYWRGAADYLIMSVTDSVWAFPTLILALAITAALGPSLSNVTIAIGLVFTPGFARLVRSMVLSVREREYVQSARSIGLNDWEIIIRYIWPNITPTMIVQASLNAAQAIIAEASMSFLGLGIQPPAASWGSMLKSGYPYLEMASWLSIFPGLAILISVLGLNFLGDGLRDAMDIKMRID
jgi:peptide/nickel transport system permease protein